MARFYAALVRHAEYLQPPDTPGALLPYPLTERGVVQAREGAGLLAEAAAELGCVLHSEIDTSTTLRAWQTAAIVREALRVHDRREFRLCQYEDLTERSVGAAANMTVEAIDRVLRSDPRTGPPPRNWKYDSFYRLPVTGAESMMTAGLRVARHLVDRMEGLVADSGQDVLKVFVGHGGSFRHAAVSLGVLGIDGVRKLSMHHCRPVVLETAANGRWRHASGEWKVRAGTEGIP